MRGYAFAMAGNEPNHSEGLPEKRSVPRSVALLLLVLALGAGALAVYFAAEASEVASDIEVLMDGIDRSNLPREEAVAIAMLARNRSNPLEDDGHDHDHGASGRARDLTETEEKLFDAQWGDAVAAVDRFDTVEEAEALGYRQASGWSDGAGYHWVKWSIVDRPFDPAEPSMLLFEELKRSEELQLIAYSYWVSSEVEPEGFIGESDSWHRHRGVCFKNGWIKDENLLRSECDGDWVNGGDLWMLHAWVVPGLDNEYGQFHNVNPFLCERVCGLEN